MSNLIDIYIDERDKCTPSFCKICGVTLQTLEDTLHAYHDGGCGNCFVLFLEPNRNIKGKKWSPSKKDIEKWLLNNRVEFKPMYKFF